MDAPSITRGCGQLIVEVTRLTVGLPIFVSNVRIARKDVDSLLRELTSLQLCLDVLKDDDRSASVIYPSSLNLQIIQILTNTKAVVQQINHVIIKLSSKKSDNAAIWSSTERHEMVRCRSVLESNRLAMDLAVTMGTISKILDQRRAVLDRLDALDRFSEGAFKNQNHGIALILEQDLDSSTSDATQLEQLRHEIADFRSQLSDLSNTNVYENMQTLRIESTNYIKSLLQPYPNLCAQLTTPKHNSSLSPSTSVSTATSSSAFTKRSHSVACSTTSIDSRSDAKRCPACTGPLITDDQEASVHTWSEKHRAIRSSWQKQLQKEKNEAACLSEEIDRLQGLNNALETGRVDDLDKHVDEIVKEKDMMIKQLLEYLHAGSFYADLKSKGLNGTIETARERYALWEGRTSTLSIGNLLNDPTMSTGAPPEEDGSDITTVEQPANVQRKPLPRAVPQPTPPQSPPKPREHVEKVIFEFSVNYVKEDIYLRGLTGRHQTLPKPVVIHAYKQWATVDAVIRQILSAATGQSQPPKQSSSGTYYLTKVTQRYDNDERPVVDVQPLASNQSVVSLNLLPGDKIRLMQGPLGFRFGIDQTNQHSRSEHHGNRQNTVVHRKRHGNSSLDEDLPEVTTIPSRSPNISPTSTNTDVRPGSISSHVRSDSMNSYLQPSITVSRALSDHSGISADTRISQPAGTLSAVPLFEFRADKVTNRIRLKPRSLITNHNSYYSSFEPPSNIYHELMITISQQVSSDPVHFREEDAAGNMRHYVTDLLEPLLRHWECDLKRIFLQVRTTLIHDSMPLQEYEITQGTSIWVMLKPFRPSDRSSLGSSSERAIPANHELWLQQPDANNLQRMSFNDANFKRIVAARKHSRDHSLGSVSLMSVRS